MDYKLLLYMSVTSGLLVLSSYKALGELLDNFFTSKQETLEAVIISLLLALHQFLGSYLYKQAPNVFLSYITSVFVGCFFFLVLKLIFRRF